MLNLQKKTSVIEGFRTFWVLDFLISRFSRITFRPGQSSDEPRQRTILAKEYRRISDTVSLKVLSKGAIDAKLPFLPILLFTATFPVFRRSFPLLGHQFQYSYVVAVVGLSPDTFTSHSPSVERDF